MAGTVGSLYVAVDIDTKQALQDLAKLKTAVRVAMSGGVTSSNTGAVGAMAGVAANTKNANTQMSGLTKNMMAFNSASNVMRAVNPGGSMGRLASSAQGLKAAMSSLSASTVVAGVVIGGIVVAAIAAAVAIGTFAMALKSLGGTGMTAASQLERLTISFESILGSAAAASKEIGTLIEIAKESPYLTDTVLNLDKFLASQGVYSGQLRGGLVNAVLDLGSALGLADANIDSITYALAQVSARGYLSGDEYRQLANQFIPIMATIKALPKYADMSNSAIRKLIETGQISSTTFFEAFIAKSQDYSDAAIKMADSVEGLKLKIQDIYEFGLGMEFLNVGDVEGAIGPLDQYRDLLRSIALTLNDIDWRPVAAGFGEIMWATVGQLKAWIDDNGPLITAFFEDYLPRAIHITAQVLRALSAVFFALLDVTIVAFSGIAQAFNTGLDSISEFGSLWTAAGALLALPIALFVSSSIIAFQLLVAALSITVSLVSSAVSAIAALFYSLVSLFPGQGGAGDQAVAAFQASGRQMADAIATSIGAIAAPLKGISAGMHVFEDIVLGFSEIGNMKLPDFENIRKAAASTGELADLAGSGAGGTGGDDGGGASSTVSELAKAMDLLWDLTRRWFGLRSDLEKGLLGEDGFEASISQIAGMGRKLVEALQVLGAAAAADLVYDGTIALMALAEKREELAEKLEAAEKHLEDVITARDSFTDALRVGAMKFANALKLETSTIDSFEMVSDRGFFVETSQKETKSFADGLQGRVDALRDFVENMKTLSVRGLDKGLLEEMLAAGPDQAGEVAAQLAAGSDEMLAEINVLEAGAQQLAEELADFGAKEFHDAGVEMAEAEAEGLRSELRAVERAAEDITAVIYDVALAFAVEMEDAGAAAGGALAAGLDSGVFEGMAGLSDDMGQYGADAVSSINAAFTMPDAWDDIIEWVDEAILLIEGFVEAAHAIMNGDLSFLPDIDWSGFWLDVEAEIGDVWAWIGETLNATIEILKGVVFAVANSEVGTWIRDTKDRVVEAFGIAWNFEFAPDISLSTLWGDIYGEIRDMATTVASWFNGIYIRWDPGINFSPVTKELWGGMYNILNGAPGFLKDLIPGYSSALTWLRGKANISTGSTSGYQGPVYEQGSLAPSVTRMSAGTVNQSDTAIPEVHVFIGDQELRGLVNTEIVVADNESVRRLVAGRLS